MRLSALARKMEVKPSDLLQFLEENDVEVNAGSNTKLSDDSIDKALAYFRPDLTLYEAENDPEQELTEEKPQDSPDPEDIEIESENEPMAENEEVTLATEISDSDDTEGNVDTEDEDIEVELIKAPKITLPGLTVKGKIDLPEPKQKEEVIDEETETSSKPEDKRNGRKGRKGSRRSKKFDENYNPLEAKRQREAKKAERERIQQAKALKESRKQKYYSKFQEKSPKSARKAQESLSQAERGTSKDSSAQSLNVFQRVWKWLNTY